MMPIPPEARAHAEQEYPREACGLIVDGRYVPCRNVAVKGDDHFVMCPADLRAAAESGELQAIVHSHPDAPAHPSDADRASCEESELPWLILEVRDRACVGHEWLQPVGWEAPLLGREFRHGVHDCLALILDYYRRERGVDLGNFHRDDEWWNNGGDLYREHLPRAGFVRLPEGTPPQTGDIILMQIRAPVPNHAGIFIADGLLTSEPVNRPVPDCLLHHLYGRLSRRDVYGGYYRDVTVGVWRYDPPTN